MQANISRKTLGGMLALGLLLAASGAAAVPKIYEPSVIGAKLRTFCQACHGLGTLRFIWSTDDAQLYADLFRLRAPTSQKLWATAIVEVLSWPDDRPPPFDQLMDPRQLRDWMPKGIKRLDFAADRIDNSPTRRLIIEALTQ